MLFMRTNNHHVLFPRKIHRAWDEGKIVREQKGLIPELDLDTHDALHKEVAVVPLLGYYALRRVANTYVSTPHDPIRSMYDYMRCVEQSVTHPRSTQLERDLADLTVRAVELQIPFVREGWVGHDQW